MLGNTMIGMVCVGEVEPYMIPSIFPIVDASYAMGR
jgi:hypothetical protein